MLKPTDLSAKCMANYNDSNEKLTFTLCVQIWPFWLLLLWPEVEDLEVGVGSEAGAELDEGLLVVAEAVPLEAEFGEAGAEPQEVAQSDHAAPGHVVAAEVESLDARTPHYPLVIWKINPNT